MSEQFFTIEPRQSGFTDQLIEFKAMYKLGSALGYTFYFQPFKSPRSANLDSSGWPMTFMAIDLERPSLMERLVGKIKRTIPLLKELFSPPEPFDVFEFSGFNDYFLSRRDEKLIAGLEEVIVEFGPDFAGSVDAHDFPALLEFVRKKINRQINGLDQVLLKFKVLPDAGLYIYAINAHVPDPFDLRAIYFEKRKKDPLSSVYPNGQNKTFMHIRQGDTAVIDTPWNSLITLWPVDQAEEYQRWEDIPYRETLIRVEDFNRFYRTLTAQFPGEKLSTLLFSDGFVRSERKLYNHFKYLDLTEHQQRDLRTSVHTFNDKKYKVFPESENFKMIIGENTQKLGHFIHSFLTADMVVGGRNQIMIIKLLNCYCSPENMPLTLILDGSADHKQLQSILDNFLDEDMQEKIVAVNLYQPDMAEIYGKIEKFLNG